MKPKRPPDDESRARRIATLVRQLQDTERELQELTGGELDAVATGDGRSYLLSDAQDQLRQAAAMQRGILNALPAHIALLSPEGLIIEVNESWRRFASANVLQSRDFFVGQNYLSVCDRAQGDCSEESAEAAEGIRRVLRGEVREFALEYPCHSPTEKRWFRMMVTPVSEERRLGAVVMHVNVTQRRLAEEQLREQELEQRRLAEKLTIEKERLHESQAVGNVGSWETDLATLAVTWTDETFRIFETTRDKFQPSHPGFLKFVHPDDRQRVDEAFVQSLGRPGPFAIEHRILLPGGKIKHIEERWQTFNDASGRAVRAVGTCQDITARILAAEVIRNRARQQEAIAKIGYEATRATSLEAVFESATRTVAEALNVDLCKVLQLAPDGSHLRLVSGVGWKPGLIGVGTVGVDRESQAGFTLQSEGAIYVNDFAQETRFKAPPLLRQHDVVSGLSVKIILRDRPWGVLGAHCRTVRRFNDADADFMQSVATLLAIVIERLAVQQVLTESEARMREAQRIAHLGNWELDIAKNELSWSDEVFRIFGVEPGKFSGTYDAFLALVHPDDRAAMQSAQKIALSGQGPLEIEHRIIRGDGEVRFVRERGELIHDENGKAVALSGTVLDVTDLRSKEDQLRLLETCVSRLNDIVLITEAEPIDDPGPRILYVNDAFVRRTGFTREEAIGKSPRILQGPKTQRDALDRIRAALKAWQPCREELINYTKAGEEFWLELDIVPVADAKGWFTHWVAIERDITERKKAEEALAQSQRQYRDLVETSHDLIWAVDAEGRITYLNSACRTIYGREPEEMIGRLFLDFVPAEQYAKDLAVFSAALASGQDTLEYASQVYRKDGSIVRLSANARVVRDRDGRIIGSTGISRDVTASEKARQDIAASEARFRGLFDQAAVGMCLASTKGVFLRTNERFCEIVGYSAEEMLNRDCVQTTHPDDRAREAATVAQMLAGELHTAAWEKRYLHRDGHAVWCNLTLSLLPGADGQPRQFVGVIEDITERRAAIEQLRQREQLLRIAGDIAHLGGWSVDLPDRRITWSDEVCAIHEMPPGTVPSLEQALGFYPPASLALLEPAFQTCAAEGTPFDLELEIVTARGRRREVRVIGLAHRNPDGLIHRVQGAFQDITENKLTQQKIQQGLSLLRIAGAIAKVGGWSVSVPGNELYWSDEIFDLVEYPRGEPPPLEQALELYPAPWRTQIGAAIARCATEGTSFELELMLRTFKGRFFWARCKAEAVRDRDDRIVQVRGAFQDISAQKEAEAQAVSLGNRLVNTLESITDAFFTLDHDWRFIYLNAEAETLLERPRAELLGANVWEKFPEAVGSQFHTEYHRAVASKQPAAFEAFYPPLEKWFEVRAFPSSEGLAVSFRDVTERRKAREALRLSEERFSLLAKATNDAVWDWDLASNQLWWNESYEVMFGYKRSEIEPDVESWTKRIHPDDHDAVVAGIHARIDSGENTWSDEYRYLRKDGSYAYVLDRGYVIRNPEGKAVRMVGGMTDLTERRRAAEALAASEREFRNLADAMPQIVWVTRPDGWNIYFNEHWMAYTGLTLEESLGHGWNKPFHPEDQQRAWEAWQQATSTVGTYSLECRLRRADGEYRWWLIRGEPQKDADGNVLKWFGTCTDIHDIKRAELEIIRTNRALKMLSACNEALIRSATEGDLLAAICRIAVDVGGFRLAWVGYANEDAHKTISCQSFAGVDDGYLAHLRVTWADNDPLRQGPAGRVIRQGQRVVIPDLETEGTYRPWLEAARASGFRGVIVLPLSDPKRTFGVLVLYLDEVRQLLPDELKLLQELADDLAFGIQHLRAQRQSVRLQNVVTKVATAVSASSGNEFFEQLAGNMAEALGAAAGFVAEMLPGEPPRARVLAGVVDGAKVENFDYAIAGTPCLQLLAEDECVFPARVAALFPESSNLASLKVEAYVGRRLTNAAGQKIGLLYVLFREPLKEAEFITVALKIFATRAASEMERQRSEATTREQAALLEIAHEAIFVKDLHDKIIYWNRGAEEVYGWTRAEAIGRVAAELLQPDPAKLSEARAILAVEGQWEGEIQKRAKDGRELTVLVRWTQVRDELSRPKSVLAINTDITERKKLEQQFLRAQRLESIGTLAGGIAHDLNNLLAPILMGVTLLQRQEVNPRSQAIIAAMERSALRGKSLVSQVLSFARGVEGLRISLEVKHALREVEAIMESTFPKNIIIETELPGNLWLVLGDPTQLNQILVNLCVNARDAMPNGGKLRIAAANTVIDSQYAVMNRDITPGRYVLIEVADSGTGIPREIIDRIFEPFFTTKETGRGTGLGLSTVAGIVRSHGGFVNVYSEPGRGSTFRVYLPAQPTETPVSADAGQSTPTEELPRGNGELILLVDDEESILSVTQQTLETFGYTVVTANDGAHAIGIYATRRAEIAAVITDMMMPIMDGPALIAALRRINPAAKIIGASGLKSNFNLARLNNSGMSHFLPKPYSASVMLTTLRSLLAK